MQPLPLDQVYKILGLRPFAFAPAPSIKAIESRKVRVSPLFSHIIVPG